MKILAIVPAYNEEDNIANVINKLASSAIKPDILIVNDGSSDLTSEVARNTGKAHVIDLVNNLGIGGAVQTGFKYAFYNNYDIAFQFDGDGQHSALELEKIVYPIVNNEAEMVIGSRFLNKENGFKSTFLRRKGIFIFKLINYLLIRQIITDNTSGFRAYNKDAIKFLAFHYTSDYPEPEAVILLGKNKYRIKEVSVEMKSRMFGRSSIYGWKTIYYMVKVLVSILMTFFRPKKSYRQDIVVKWEKKVKDIKLNLSKVS